MPILSTGRFSSCGRARVRGGDGQTGAARRARGLRSFFLPSFLPSLPVDGYGDDLTAQKWKPAYFVKFINVP